MPNYRHVVPSRCVAAAFSAACWGAVASAQNLPRPAHVVIVVEENHSYSQIIGPAGSANDTAAPYINSLARAGASFTGAHGVEHESQPTISTCSPAPTRNCFTGHRLPSISPRF